jgi:hypothetical protein
MWNIKTNVIPVIIGATGIISKSFRKYLKNLMTIMKGTGCEKEVVAD